MNALRAMLRIVLLTAVVATVYLLVMQERMMYFPREYEAAVLKVADRHGVRRLEVETSQGRQVAFYQPPRQGAAAGPEFLWWVFGGNGALALDYRGETPGWDGRFAYLFVDYPGYGLCEGSPNPARITESIEAVAAEARKTLGWTPEDMAAKSGALGHSLGCAAALATADSLQLSRVVLCAPFTTMTEMARLVVGWPLCHLNRHRYDNITPLDALMARGGQASIFHGAEDAIIPVRMGRELARRHETGLRFAEVPVSGHNDVVITASREIGREMLRLSGLPDVEKQP